MATSEVITGGDGPVIRSLSKDINEVINPAFAATAMLQGASALLVNAEHIPDPDGNIWAAREIVDAVISKIQEIYTAADEKKLGARADALEAEALANVP